MAGLKGRGEGLRVRQMEQNSLSEKTYDPIEDVLKMYPKLTRKEALEMAEEFGF